MDVANVKVDHRGFLVLDGLAVVRVNPSDQTLTFRDRHCEGRRYLTVHLEQIRCAMQAAERSSPCQPKSE
jgi:hypothetical protein